MSNPNGQRLLIGKWPNYVFSSAMRIERKKKFRKARSGQRVYRLTDLELQRQAPNLPPNASTICTISRLGALVGHFNVANWFPFI